MKARILTYFGKSIGKVYCTIFRETNYQKKEGKDLLEKCKDVQKMLESTKLDQRKKSLPKDTRLINRYGNLSKRLGTKNEAVQKVEVFLSSQENNDTNSRNLYP